MTTILIDDRGHYGRFANFPEAEEAIKKVGYSTKDGVVWLKDVGNKKYIARIVNITRFEPTRPISDLPGKSDLISSNSQNFDPKNWLD